MDSHAANQGIKLVYFAVRGRVEPARLMLEMCGVPYEFTGIPAEVWPTAEGKARYQAVTPLAQLPMLSDGGFTLCQSGAIYRYLGRKLDLLGATPEQSARVDEVSETAGDLLLDLGMLFWDPRFEARRAEHRDSFRGKLTLLQDYFGRVAADEEHWVVRDRFTLADVRMAFALETALPLHPGLIEEFPKLHRAMSALFAADGVRQYVQSARRARTYTVSRATFGGQPEQTHQFTDESAA